MLKFWWKRLEVYMTSSLIPLFFLSPTSQTTKRSETLTVVINIIEISLRIKKLKEKKKKRERRGGGVAIEMDGDNRPLQLVSHAEPFTSSFNTFHFFFSFIVPPPFLHFLLNPISPIPSFPSTIYFIISL